MPRFFVEPEAVDREAGIVTINGDDARHIARSLRMAVGERISVCDGEGNVLDCRLDTIRDDEVRASVLSEGKSLSEPPYALTVYQALVKGDRTETVVMKSVEYGATSIVLFESSNCVMRRSDSDSKKLLRYGRIAKEAAMQSGRGRIPEIIGPLSFNEAIRMAAGDALPLFCYEAEDRRKLGDILPQKVPDSVSVMIGPEGGFSQKEAAAAASTGLICVSLGHRILRTESAAPFALAALSLKYELS